MIELELLGTSGDGGSLVFTDADGQRYSVLITDELRGATRRDRPRMEVAAARRWPPARSRRSCARGRRRRRSLPATAWKWRR